ncbi:hypothetical protein AMS68_007866 [Peltaster fructicola]|uniref:Uncharacterized protein n=1 Tax=Peltaster fructicola TaxID=286661 RepID=A0A6H0Y688_9PEZI|nr:hypothetical protein AMS68_007866 [Peltaster fructicola]
MSRYNDDYDDGPQRYHTVRTRRRDADDPDYVREETYVERGKGAGPPPPHDLVYRGREDSIEDIDREFPPPSGGGRGYGGYNDGPRRARSVRDRGYDDDYYDDDRYTDYAAGGAAAGYAAGHRGASRHRRRRDRSRDRDYSPSRYSDDSRRPEKERRKSGVEDLIGGLGLGGVAAALLGKDKDKDKDRDRRDDRSVMSRSRSRPGMSRAGRSYRSEGDHSPDRSKDTGKKWTHAAQAALIAGAIEAVRARNLPGPWTGEKGKRIATAAFGAGGLNGVLDKNPNEKQKRHLVESVAGGLVGNYVINGSRSKSRGREFDRSHSPDAHNGRSRSIMDRLRGRSASRGPPPRGRQKGSGVKELESRGRDSSADSYRSRRRGAVTTRTRQMSRQGGTDRAVARRDTNNNNNGNNDRAIAAGAGGGAGALAARGGGDEDKKSNQNESDSSSTTSMENKRKKMRWREKITAGLAAVATIHAAHGVYSSMEAHEKRHRLVAEGEMTPEEARKKQSKAWVQDAAAVGIAALGIKGAFSEWKEMREQRGEIHELEKRKRERRKKLAARKRKEEEERHQQIIELMDKNPQAAMLMMHQDSLKNGRQPMPMMFMPPPTTGGGGYNQGGYTPNGYAGPGAGQVEQSGNPYAPRAGT